MDGPKGENPQYRNPENYRLTRREFLVFISIIAVFTISLIKLKSKELVNNIFSKSKGLFDSASPISKEITGVKSVFMSVHYNDRDFNLNDTELTYKLKTIKEQGIDAIRFDFRINDFHEFEERYIEKTKKLMALASIQQLELIPIISSPRLEDNDVYRPIRKEDILKLKSLFTELGLKLPDKVQILNEWNNNIYTPNHLLMTIPELIAQTREIFGPNTKILGTMFCCTTLSDIINNLIGIQEISEFIETNQSIINKIDILAIDYYPGTWELSSKSFSNSLYEKLNMAKLIWILDFIKSKCPKLEIEIGEIGAAKLIPMHLGERRQALLTLGLCRTLLRSGVINKYGIKTLGLYVAESPKAGEANLGLDFGLIHRPVSDTPTHLTESFRNINDPYNSQLKRMVGLLKRNWKRDT